MYIVILELADSHRKLCLMHAVYIYNFYSLDVSNIFEFPIKWQQDKGLDPATCPLHEEYLTQMCGKVSLNLEQRITEAADRASMQSSNATYQEVLTHGGYCRNIVQTCVVR